VFARQDLVSRLNGPVRIELPDPPRLEVRP